MATLTTWLSLGGLSLDFIGAAFLAYDVLYGPEARFQAAIRRDRLTVARGHRERLEQSLREPSEPPYTPENEHLRREELRALTRAIDDTLAELKHWEKHEHRAVRKALLGLLLLMAGFACQGLGTVLSITADVPVRVGH